MNKVAEATAFEYAQSAVALASLEMHLPVPTLVRLDKVVAQVFKPNSTEYISLI